MTHRNEYPARLVRVIDGDTIEVDAYAPGLAIARTGLRVRIPTIDTPEVKGPTRAAGLAAAAFARAWIDAASGPAVPWPLLLVPQLDAAGDEDETLGRLVAEVHRRADRKSLAAELLAAGHARPFVPRRRR